MQANPNLEKAQSYLSLNIAPHGRAHAISSALPFVTLSRQAGAGATTLARLVTQQLNLRILPDGKPWRVYDGNLVQAMLRDSDYPDHLAQFLPEDTLSEIDASIGEILGRHPNLWEMIQKTNQLIRRLARQGNCILIGRAANFVTADLPNGMHLRLIARVDDRINHLAQQQKISTTVARLRNQFRDKARDRFVKGHYNRDVNDPQDYDMVINTSHISAVEAGRILIEMIEARTPVRLNGY